MFETIRIETDARGVATLRLNRPERHNALSALMIDELTAATAALGRDKAVRVVVLTGIGESFCAGGDLNWMREQMGADAETRAEAAKSIAMMLNALNTLPKPLIGRVQGNAFGGGVGLACVCDVVVADETALFGLTETRLGLIPATIGPYVIARIGEAKARRVFMSSRRFDCAEAVDLGIVARAVTAEAIDQAVENEIIPYLSCAPGAVAEAKAMVRRLGPVIDEAVIADSVAALVTRWESAEAQQGIDAFFNKTNPGWIADQ
ncbi:MAG: crotonase/enoyl-CoA hydratase family protein [Paracoccaceae bacterium]